MKIYNLIYRPISNLIGLALYPIALFNKRLKEHTRALIPKFSNSLWFHASSVGEINGLKPLLERIIENYPQENIIVTTMTTTGRNVAQQISPKISTSLVPFDSSFLVKKFIRKINPKILILAETELWFSMINECSKLGIPIMLSNARISNRSFPRYLKHKRIFGPLLKRIEIILAQSQLDKERFEDIGAENVILGGNLKFCVNLPKFDTPELRKEYGYHEDDLIITWGSSRPGEELLMINSFFKLREEFPNIKLILVLRHISRIKEVEAILETDDYTILSNFTPGKPILLVDTMGVLNQFYAISDISIVGGSFCDFGGHNPLEPAFYSKPTIIGEYHSSCQDSVDKLSDNGAIIISKDDKLLSDLRFMIENYGSRKTLGEKANLTLNIHANALDINLQEFDKIHKRISRNLNK
ncbi:hypothetical protein JEZ13_06685 [bacterium]|nr:hypothetical protein [bacterium]